MSTSTWLAPPPGTIAPGADAACSRATTSGVARPLRSIPSIFWNAVTADCVVVSKLPSTLPTS